MTPQALRMSLDTRLRKEAQRRGRSIQRTRTLLVMERFLDRLVRANPERFVLKGGLAMELRLGMARATRDIDLRATGTPDLLTEQLQRAARRRPSPEDHLEFAVVEHPRHPTIDGEGVLYEGRRFQVRATLASKPFGDAFGLDVAYGDPMSCPPESVVGSSFFAHYGIEPVEVRVYPLTSHVAEKLHALTLPREGVNSRTKDLVDLAIFATQGGHDATALRDAIHLTFEARDTHSVPRVLPASPDIWHPRYKKMRADDTLPWADLAEVEQKARAFLEPVLSGVTGAWDASTEAWS